MWGASKDLVLKWEQGAEGGVGAELESAACELGSFVLTEWLYAGVQFKGLAKAQLLSFAVWMKGEEKGVRVGYDTGGSKLAGLIPGVSSQRWAPQWNGSKYPSTLS